MIYFLLGLFLGVALGVFAMCLIISGAKVPVN